MGKTRYLIYMYILCNIYYIRNVYYIFYTSYIHDTIRTQLTKYTLPYIYMCVSLSINKKDSRFVFQFFLNNLLV